tara:strand:- start:81 stop:662 length:582 start_codon:yes stop_codon:yes gene_type:complete
MKLIYVQDDFLNPELCKPFIDLYENSDSFLETVTHSNPNDSLTVNPEIPKFEFDANYGAKYLGGKVDPVDLTSSKDELFSNVIMDVTRRCKTFDDNIKLQYVGVVRWPIGTFMKPHIDDNNVHEPDVFAAMLYLNDNFTGGSTLFEDIEIKPKPGKLIIFSNHEHLHYVSEVGGAERFVLSFWYSRPNADIQT